MVSLPASNPRAEFRDLKRKVLNLRLIAYAIATVSSIVVAAASGSEQAMVLAVLGGTVLVFSVVFRGSLEARLDVGLAIDAVGAVVLWWLFGPVAAVDFVIVYVVAVSALMLRRTIALGITGFLLLVTLAQLVLDTPDIRTVLPLFHLHGDGEVGMETVSRTILLVGSAVVFLTIAGVIRRVQAATAESEHRFRVLVEGTPDAIVVHDGSVILFANPAAAELVGADLPGEIHGMPIERFIHPDSRDHARSRAIQVLQGEEAKPAEMKIIRLDGEVILVENVDIPATFDSKPASQVVLRNITEQRKAHQALQESEERYKSFFEGVPTPLYRTTPDGRILDANAALVALLRYPDRQSLLDLSVEEAYVRPADRTTSQEILHREGAIADYEQELIRYDGTRIWARDTSRIVADPDGTILYYEGAMVDITQRKRAEGTTRRLIRILEATPDFVIIADEHGHIQYANEAARRFARIADETAVQSVRVRDVLAAEETDSLSEIMKSDVWTGVLSIRSPDGTESPASTVVINHRDIDGNIEYFSAVARDISDRIEAERRLEQLIRSKDDFVASVSHELRTPLTAVVGLTQELRDRRESFTEDETFEFVSLIADQSVEVANIVEDLLVAARADIGRITITASETAVGEQIAAVLNALGMENNDRVSVDIDDETRAWADPSRLRQIIRNLVTNAVRYGGNAIELAVQRNNGSVLITVTDDGAGVPEDHRESIFEPYERAHAAGSQPASVGLGLTVSRQLARLMGGDLTYRPEPRGSSFELSLPAYND